MLDLQEISDRMEIRDLLVDYAYKLDEGDFDGLREVFTRDAKVDYTEPGGIAGDVETIIAYLKRAMPKVWTTYQHMMGNTKLALDGDRAEAVTQCYNPGVMSSDRDPRTVFVGLWYVDKLVRTPDGWRISNRYERLCYTHNFPETFKPAE